MSENNQKSFSAADELLKFKQLLDDGVITQEEFNAQKEKLFGTPKKASSAEAPADSTPAPEAEDAAHSATVKQAKLASDAAPAPVATAAQPKAQNASSKGKKKADKAADVETGKDGKSKKKFYQKWWFWVIVVILLFALIKGCSGGSDSSTTEDTTAGNSQSEEVSEAVTDTQGQKVYVAGETYQDDNIKVTYLWNNPYFTDYSQYADVPSGYKVVQACFDFENVGSTDLYASSGDFNCFADNVSCDSFTWVDDWIFSDELSPGRQATGKCVYFVVPENAQSIVLEYQPSLWSSDKVIFQIQ